jgi:glycosyltransferase involved in cell wall biosynthesis
MLSFHRLLKTWSDEVDLYLALSDHARSKFIEGGLPAHKIMVKPNFVHPDPGERECQGEYMLFVGRLSPEKGLRTLLRAWQIVGDIPLRIIGDGPLMRECVETIHREHLHSVEVTGQLSLHEVLFTMKRARCLLVPSECCEGPMNILEAFACGVPVTASCLGAMAEMVDAGRTGLHFEPGNPEDLASKVEWAWNHPALLFEMGKEARKEFLEKYTADQNYSHLMQAYEFALERSGKP